MQFSWINNHIPTATNFRNALFHLLSAPRRCFPCSALLQWLLSQLFSSLEKIAMIYFYILYNLSLILKFLKLHLLTVFSSFFKGLSDERKRENNHKFSPSVIHNNFTFFLSSRLITPSLQSLFTPYLAAWRLPFFGKTVYFIYCVLKTERTFIVVLPFLEISPADNHLTSFPKEVWLIFYNLPLMPTFFFLNYSILPSITPLTK